MGIDVTMLNASERRWPTRGVDVKSHQGYPSAGAQDGTANRLGLAQDKAGRCLGSQDLKDMYAALGLHDLVR
jgi:hypothetical protein